MNIHMPKINFASTSNSGGPILYVYHAFDFVFITPLLNLQLYFYMTVDVWEGNSMYLPVETNVDLLKKGLMFCSFPIDSAHSVSAQKPDAPSQNPHVPSSKPDVPSPNTDALVPYVFICFSYVLICFYMIFICFYMFSI